MAYVIAEPCIGTKDTACVDVALWTASTHGKMSRISKKRHNFILVLWSASIAVPVFLSSGDGDFRAEDLPEKWAHFTPINADWYTNKA